VALRFDPPWKELLGTKSLVHAQVRHLGEPKKSTGRNADAGFRKAKVRCEGRKGRVEKRGTPGRGTRPTGRSGANGQKQIKEFGLV